MISLKNPDQIAKMRKAGALLYEVLQKLREAVKPGVSTAALDAYAEQLIRKNHAIPSFLNYEGYPASICASVDDAVVHGIPNKKQVLKEGEIIFVEKRGVEADATVTLDQVLAVVDGESSQFGAPVVAGASVEAKGLKTGKSKKITVFKYRAKKDSKSIRGHRQPYTKVQIEKISV